MINVKELRIGNWINKKDQRVQVTAEMILIIQRFPVRYKPALLTEARLIEWKFIEKAHYNGNTYELLIHYSNGFKDFISLTNKGETAYPLFLSLLTTNYQKSFVLSKEIKYEHQLQNLCFTLTGKELPYD